MNVLNAVYARDYVSLDYFRIFKCNVWLKIKIFEQKSISCVLFASVSALLNIILFTFSCCQVMLC